MRSCKVILRSISFSIADAPSRSPDSGKYLHRLKEVYTKMDILTILCRDKGEGNGNIYVDVYWSLFSVYGFFMDMRLYFLLEGPMTIGQTPGVLSKEIGTLCLIASRS